ncbi:hypothetical protein [Cyanobium sp. NIES-981]|uniref:hypothetical protein n=1 Tax=Cyanobium sp. NIES-981 TaxID=1851505 RepID=UPI0007DCEA82|nr:hypothetical protein [Cyanobium sp. NIES-981]SBO42383.1 conserved exported protein of unknown function [Cyanobium sp. NIES-981]
MAAVMPLLAAAAVAAASPAAGAPLSEKEAFMLMFGKGNGAMRTLCVLERDGLITAEQRRRYSETLTPLLLERADDAVARRNLRVGMAFADGRASLCPSSVFSGGVGTP